MSVHLLFLDFTDVCHSLLLAINSIRGSETRIAISVDFTFQGTFWHDEPDNLTSPGSFCGNLTSVCSSQGRQEEPGTSLLAFAVDERKLVLGPHIFLSVLSKACPFT